MDQTIQILVHRLIDHQEQQNPRKSLEETKKKCVHRHYSFDDSSSQASNQPCSNSASFSSQPISSNLSFTSDCVAKKEVTPTPTPFILNLGSVVNNNLMLVAGQSASLSMLSTCNSTKRQQQFSGKCNSQPTSQNSSFAIDDQTDSQSRGVSLSQDLSDIQLCEQNSNSFSLSRTNSYTNSSNSFCNGYQQQTHDSHLLQDFSNDISGTACTAPHDNNNKQFGIIGNIKSDSSAQIQPSSDTQMTSSDIQKLSSVENISLEDFNLDLMSGDKDSPSDISPQKDSMSGIADCLDGFSTNLSPINGSDILVNLEQLESLDLPDIEKICNAISNESNSPTSQESHNLIHKDNTYTGLNHVNFKTGCDSDQNTGNHSNCNNRIECTNSAKNNFDTMTTRECVMMPEVTSVCHSRAVNSQHPVESPSTIALITDFCPDWAYSEVSVFILTAKRVRHLKQ